MKLIEDGKVRNLICGILETEASKWFQINKSADIGMDLTSITDSLNSHTNVDVFELMSDVLGGEEGEELLDVVIHMADEGVVDGETILQRVEKEWEVLENGGSIVSNHTGRHIVGK